MSHKVIAPKSDFEFKTIIEENELVLADFYAYWCGPCRVIAPYIEELAKEYTNVVFVKVDVDVLEKTAEILKISAMPTFIAFHNGEVVNMLVGANKTKLRSMASELNKKFEK